jgi:hypothetical protein
MRYNDMALTKDKDLLELIDGCRKALVKLPNFEQQRSSGVLAQTTKLKPAEIE